MERNVKIFVQVVPHKPLRPPERFVEMCTIVVQDDEHARAVCFLKWPTFITGFDATSSHVVIFFSFV